MKNRNAMQEAASKKTDLRQGLRDTFRNGCETLGGSTWNTQNGLECDLDSQEGFIFLTSEPRNDEPQNVSIATELSRLNLGRVKNIEVQERNLDREKPLPLGMKITNTDGVMTEIVEDKPDVAFDPPDFKIRLNLGGTK